MEEKVIIEIILLILCFISMINIVIFILRKNDEEVNYYRLIKDLNERKKMDLEVLRQGNKEIDDIEYKILECKRELGFKLFKK